MDAEKEDHYNKIFLECVHSSKEMTYISGILYFSRNPRPPVHLLDSPGIFRLSRRSRRSRMFRTENPHTICQETNHLKIWEERNFPPLVYVWCGKCQTLSICRNFTSIQHFFWECNAPFKYSRGQAYRANHLKWFPSYITWLEETPWTDISCCVCTHHRYRSCQPEAGLLYLST